MSGLAEDESGGWESAEQMLLNRKEDEEDQLPAKSGRVFSAALDGDTEVITVKGAEKIGQADHVQDDPRRKGRRI